MSISLPWVLNGEETLGRRSLLKIEKKEFEKKKKGRALGDAFMIGAQ